MSEFFFVIRCLMATIAVVFVMQLKISGISVESRAEDLIRSSQATVYLQEAARGGATAIQDAYYSVKSFVLDSTSSFRQNESKANRSR